MRARRRENGLERGRSFRKLRFGKDKKMWKGCKGPHDATPA